MSSYRIIKAVAVVVFANAASASGWGALHERKSSLRSKAVDMSALLRADLNKAMGEALGCGGHVGEQQLAAIEQTILPVYRILPKNGHGYIERRSLRFIAYRYFMKQSALMLRGFEPSRSTNASSWGNADILSQRVPAYVESVLQSKHAQEKGFNLRDAVQMVATLEQLIFDEESILLELAYINEHKPMDRPLSQQDVEQILELYMIHWMMGEDTESIEHLAVNHTLREVAFPHWHKIVEFTQGQVKATQFQREHIPKTKSRSGHNALSPRFSFEEVHDMVGRITKSFASFWESECSSMKALLVQMDTHRTGRVPLSKFYGKGLDSDWRFGESEAYLRELGAMDETSWRGKQVIIANYIQAASNCVVAMPHYMVCCTNDCEFHLTEIETSIGAPTASPSQILELVGSMTATITLDDDEPPHLEGALTVQLEQIAAVHDGQVPLHGRLFAQWLHYVFPRECAFPHRTGAVAAVTPMEFGENFIASEDEMRSHSADASDFDIPAAMDKEELQWMSQWSSEEELVLEEDALMHAPWETDNGFVVGTMAILIAILVGILKLNRQKRKSSNTFTNSLLPTHRKAHFV